MAKDNRIYEHFSEKELACRCGECGLGQNDMDISFMIQIERLRKETGIVMNVSSAIRCNDWNNVVSESGYTGPHTPQNGFGHAIDIKIHGRDLFRLLKKIYELFFFTGVGLKQSGPHNHRFLHLDNLPNSKDRPREWIWTY